MINNLQINGFKCFEEVNIDLGKITLFSGTNSSGKSSAIQALLIINNVMKNPNSPLNGNGLKLGNFEEARNFITRPNFFSIEILNSQSENIIFKCSSSESKVNYKLNIDLNYLSANRIGPENIYLKNYHKNDYIGENGEYLFDLLFNNKTFLVDVERRKSKDAYTLEFQVNFWLNKILNVNIDLQDFAHTEVSATYSYNKNKNVNPYHVGAGISYMVGIIILGLYVKKGSILVVENPEIHLHPKAQSDLADFFCFIANAGVQVILESHSDHIFNGIRKSVYNKTISNEDVKIHFFEMNEENISENYLINLSDKGKILDYQQGLFDQFDNDLNVLLGF